MSKSNNWKSSSDYLIEAYTNKLINDYKQDDEKEKERQKQRALTNGTSNSTNYSTTSQKSSYGSQAGSQDTPAEKALFKMSGREFTNKAATDPTRRNSRGQTVTGRERTRSAVNSPDSKSRIKEDTGKWARSEAYGALTGFNKELASAADFLLPDVITPKKVQNVLDYYRKADEEQQQKVQELRGDSKLREIAGTIGGETLKNIPSAAMAMLSGGTSVGAQVAGEAVPSLLEGARLAKTGNVVSRALDEVARTSGQNPMFWETFMRTVGPTYDNEIANGADPVRATMSAYANALLNAQIEIGGGIEKYDPSEVFWKAALRSAKEEGMEEVQQYAVENLVNKAIGSNRTKDKNGNTIETPWFSMDRGVNAVINPVDMAEQGFYGAAAGGLMSGGRTLGVNAVNDARNNNYRQEHPDFEEHAKDLIQRASVQGREGEMSTKAQNLAEEVSEQMARGQQPTAYQMRELESAVATDEYYNQKAYENSSKERYNQAVEEGKADTVQQTGSTDEYYGFRHGLNETEQRNYEKAKAVMGENASENSVLAVSKLMTGSESNRDIDTILLDPEARSAVEELAEVTLPINNVKARAELENIALVNQIANRDKILEQTHKDIRTNMSRRGGELFDENYDEAVKTLDVPNAAEIYENFFSRFYTAGTVEDADFEKTYNRIISPLVEDFGEDFGSRISQVFNHDFAQKVFAQGQIAMNSVRAKAQGRNLSVKASENPAGFTYEEEARKHISDREADLFTKLAERAKVHIRLVSSIAGGQANGSYDPETGVILIAADSDNKFITVFKHELTHHLKNTSPEMYQKLEDFVFKKWYDGDPEKMEERVQEYQRRYNMRPDQAREEIIADASEAFFTDEGAINEAVTFNEKMARAIHDGIKSLLDTFLDLVDTDRRADKGYGDFLKDLDILRDAEKMWLEALNESVGKSNAGIENGVFADNSTGENVQFSLRTEAPPKKTRKGYKVFVVKNGELYPPMVANPNGDPTPVGVWLNADEGVRAGTSKTGRPQVQAGGKGTQGGSGTLAYRPGWHLGEIPLAKQFMRQDANGNKTLFPKNFVWAECEIAADVDYQDEAMSYGYTEKGKFRHAYAGLPKIPKDGFYQYRTNPNPDTVPWLITGAMKINRILSDAEVSNILAKEGIEAPKRQGGDKTLEELGIKNVKLSLKDSDGNTLSKGQQDYFKDSKVRDDDGNLLVMYHGTREKGFTVFNPSESQDGISLFFTDKLDVAKGYSGVKKTFAPKIEKPTLAKIQKVLEREDDGYHHYKIAKTDNGYEVFRFEYDWDLGEDGEWVRNDRKVNDWFNYESESLEDIANYIKREFSNADESTNYKVYLNLVNPLIVNANGRYFDELGDLPEGLEDTRAYAEYAKRNGYDGVIFKDIIDTALFASNEERFEESNVVIAFSSNQIKSVANKNPTENEDIRYSLKEAPPVEELDKSGATLTTNNGQPIAKFEENGSVQFSLKTYDDQGRRIYKEYLDKMVKNGQLSRAEAKQMFDEIETIYKISREFADTGKYAPFTAWSNAQVVTGENGKPVFSAIKKNSEYKMNIDFSTICKKRRTLDNVFRVMVNRGLFEKLDLNKDESAALVVNINDLIREHGFEAACALCFVEARRYRQQQTATTFRDMWNGLVESMYKDKSKIEYFNYGENNEKEPVPDGIHTMPDKDLNLTKLKRLANAKNDEGKPLQTAEAKAARLLLRDPSQRKLMLVGDMMASTGFENMQVKNPELMKIYNAKKGTGGAKSSFGDVQYLNEILRPRTFGRMSAYAVSGVRIQSFSDYVPRMVFDYVQVIGDLAAKRLPAHAYTKEVLFALQFGLTGVKINMSLVPDVVADGVAPGLDKNGNYIWNKEGTFPWEDYVDKNGRKMPGARSIQKAKGYKEHCGTIAVGISDAQIWKMLLDPEIQMVIPYHKSSLNPLVAAMTNVDRFTDYTDYQNTRDKNGKAVEKEFDWDRKLFRLSHGSNNKLLPRSEWGDVQALVKEYVDWCNKHEYTPKFSQFLYMREGNSMDGDFILDENGNKVINSGYYKMLEDFALYDNDGKFKPQDDVRMNFPTDESAYGSMASLIEQGLDEDAKLEAKRTNEIDGIVDEIESMIEDGSITKQTIFSEALAKKMEDKFQYSLKSGGESRNYQNTISKLESQVKDLKAEFKRTDLKTADPKDVRIQAGKLIKRHDSNMSVQGELVDTFNRIFRLYKENGTDSFDDIYEIAKNAAVEVVNNISIVHDEGAEDYKAIKEYLKETPIVITEEMKKNITDFNNFRKRYFGKLKLVNGDTGNIDNVYMELNELFPGQFTEDYVNPADQLYHMADVLDNYAPYYETLDGASPEMQDYVVDIAADIMETAYGLQTKKTFADKKYEEKVKAVAKAREKALESRDNALNRQKQRYEKKIEGLKAHNQEMRANRKARREDSEARTKLLKIARRLDRFKTTAAKKEQIEALIGDLDLVAKGMTDKTLNDLHDLRDWYSDKKETDPDFIADSNIEKKLERLSKKHIKDMDLADVRELYDVLSNIENELKTERKLINSEMKKDIKEAGREAIRNINNSKGLAMKTRGFDRFFINGTLSPLRQIRRVTGYNDNDPLYIATKELADGQRKMIDYQMTSWKAFDRFMKNKDFIRSINGPKAKEIEVTGIKDGKQYKTKITPDIRMAMYLASMNADNLRHMRDGGVKLPDIKLYKKGKISEAMEKGTIVKFSPSMLNEITSHMTKTERAFAQEAYKYYNETSPEAINKVSEELKGYSIARVQNYYPIHTDSNFLSKEFEAMKFDGTIEGMGFLKERVRASNPILMTGLVDELTRSIEMNSKYVGLAIPVRNFGKIYGVNDVTYTERNEGGVKTLEADYRGSVKDSISDKWGGAVASYIEKFMTDLQNGRKNYDDWGNFFSKLRSNYAGAVLTLNASVALKQAASYPTAAAVLGRAPLVKAMGNFGKVDLDLIAKYTPLQWYRSQGFSTTELGDIRSGNKQSLLNKYPFLNWIQGIDLATTRKLWKASEYYVQDHNKNLKKGTDEYYKTVADIYNRVIEETQPNYTTMQRPGLLRSDNDIVLALNMFKTQPYQNFNILYDSIGNYVAKRNQYNKVKNADTKKALQNAGRDMRNAIDSQIMQLAVFAAMTSLWALFRRKDDKYRDKEGNLTFVSYLERLAKDMLANSFAVVPFGSDIYGTVSSSITGEYYYGFSSVTDSSVTDLLDSFSKGYKTIGEWVQYAMNDDPEKGKPDSDMYKDIVSVSESASRFLGAPFSNMKNLGTGIYGWVAISKDGKYVGTYEAQKMTLAKKSEMMDNLFQAYRHDKAAYEQIRKMMIEDGIKEDSIDTSMKKKMKEHKSDTEQKEYDSSMQALEKSSIWKGASADDQEYYKGIIEKMSVGIEDTSTGYVTNKMKSGLTEEQVILYKLALKKVDKPSASGKYGSYTKAEREAAIRLLEKEFSLTYAQKETLKG